jgi:hypothetical protein
MQCEPGMLDMLAVAGGSTGHNSGSDGGNSMLQLHDAVQWDVLVG